jgi:hypothetical protein
MTSGDFAGIRINIWNQAKVRRFITHSLAGGGSHNLGFHALRWEMILHGNAGEMGKYAVLSTLLDKIARFLYEYHDTSYTSLGLPAIALDRSTINVHGILRPDQVQCVAYMYHTYTCIIYTICHTTLKYAKCVLILHILHI